jgi:hypothetical protein
MPFIPDKPTGKFVPDSAPPAQQEPDSTLKDTLLSIVSPQEASLNVATGMVAKPIADIAGLGATAYDVLSGNKEGDPEGFRKSIEEALTYQPRGESGKNLADVAKNVLGLPSKAIGLISKPAGNLVRGDSSSDTVRGALANAVEEGINQGAGFAVGKGIKALKGVTDKSLKNAASAAAERSGQLERINQVRNTAAQEGYVVPASQAQDTLWNHIKETVAGGAGKSQRKASVQNQEITNDLVRKTLGMPEDMPITSDNLAQLRAKEGAAYSDIEQWGSPMHSTPEYRVALDNIRKTAKNMEKFQATKSSGRQIHEMLSDLDKPRMPPKDAVFLMRRLREDARNNLNSAKAGGGDSAKTDLGNAQKEAARALESMVEKNLDYGGAKNLADAFRSAREKIAQSYTVEKALNPSTGDVSAVKLFNDMKRGKMVGGQMRKAAEFAGAFPKSSQLPSAIGSTPALNNLDMLGAVLSPKGALKAVAKPLISAGSVKSPKPIVPPSPTVLQAINRLSGSNLLIPGTVGVFQQGSDQSQSKE